MLFLRREAPTIYNLAQPGEVARVSRSVAERGTFGDPFSAIPTGFTAHVAPAYVFVYAAVAKLFGMGRAGAIALWSLNVGFLALAVRFASCLVGSPWAWRPARRLRRSVGGGCSNPIASFLNGNRFRRGFNGLCCAWSCCGISSRRATGSIPRFWVSFGASRF